jgi:Ca-activated chloride channel family protein
MEHRSRFAVGIVVILALTGSTIPVDSSEVALTQGAMRYTWVTTGEDAATGRSALDLPLKKTVVRAEVSGFVARVTVQQFFSNPVDRRIEAVYQFPLPANAAVHESTIRIGDRLVVAEIKEREAARKKYEKAKAAGKRASLLEQERPNIFTQSVANIGPGEEIVVAIRYVQELAYDDERYTFTFPMTIGHRFIPGAPTGRSGHGSSDDTDLVADASRVTPPILPPELRSGRDIELSLTIDAGFPIAEISSPSHEVALTWDASEQVAVSLDPADRIPNKDFVLDYRIAGKGIETALLTHRTGKEGTFLLMVQPPAETTGDEAVPKEMVFVLDCSGSMSGNPMAASKRLMKRFIAGMNPDDSFQVIRFSESASSLSPAPLENTAANRARGLAYVDALRGAGGTMMIEGIRTALDFKPDPDRQRMVFFLTDGYIGNEAQILAAIRDKVGDTRLYSLGVGSAPNRFLIDEIAAEGRGFSQYVGLNDDPSPAVDRFYRRLNLPVLTAVETDWGELEVIDPLPASVPDLFHNQPVFLVGRYRKPGSATFVLRGRRGHGWAEIPVEVELPERETANPALEKLWARRKIAELMRRQRRQEIPEVRAEILELALEHRLMSRYTSFVAVERKLKEGVHLPLETVLIPSELPEGASYDGFFGPPILSHQRIKPGDPVLRVKAPPEALAVLAEFPFGLRKNLQRDPVTGLWSCRYLVPRDQSEGRYRIHVRIVLPHGDWVETFADYVVDETPPRFAVEARLEGRTIFWRAVPVGGGVDPGSVEHLSGEVFAVVIPDAPKVLVRPPQGGYVVLEPRPSSDAPAGRIWTGTYELPSWYASGSYTFRFLAMDEARNTFTTEIAVRVPEVVAARGPAR